ncbi:DUF6122 family protein [Gallaecimonas sp. GXIMD4217]|uniref:DUF6122 family protein n=1 Tax=Gallaecimonas sp. GXIMD4217 TaxID=3131927 RepID=UPI00311B14C1
MLSSALHMVLHFLLPALVARLGFRAHWRRAWLIMVATMAVDIDHLLAEPLFDPLRCSIGFHPLHQYPMVALYLGLTLFRPTRLVGLGLVIHMLLDGLDCLKLI